MPLPSVFLDTNILSYTAGHKVDQRSSMAPGKHQSPGKPDRDIRVVSQASVGRAARVVDSAEVDELPKVVALAKAGKLEVCWSHEVELELLCQPRLVGMFYGEKIEHSLVPGAIDYRPKIERFTPPPTGLAMSPGPILKNYIIALQSASPERAVVLLRDYLMRLPDEVGLLHYDYRHLHVTALACHDTPKNAAGLLFPLLQALSNPRYVAILDMLQVRQLSSDRQPNGYLDAFLLWTAELGGCSHFLTVDSGVVQRHAHESLSAVLPSQLLSEFS